MVHYDLFLFDYRGFHKEAQPLVERADAGDYSTVVEHADRVARKMTGRWILEDLGTGIERFEQLRAYHPSQKQTCGLVGIAYLIILSQYLEEIDYDWPRVLARWLMLQGWDPQIATLMADGMAHTALLKPEIVDDPLIRPNPHDPRWNDPAYYWWWVRPERAYSMGWWNIEQIKDVHHRLIASRSDIEHFDISLMESDLAVHSHLDMSPREKLLYYYETALKVLELALIKERGLLEIFAE